MLFISVEMVETGISRNHNNIGTCKGIGSSLRRIRLRAQFHGAMSDISQNSSGLYDPDCPNSFIRVQEASRDHNSGSVGVLGVQNNLKQT